MRSSLARLKEDRANPRSRIADHERFTADQKQMIEKQSARITELESQLADARTDADRIRNEFDAKLAALEARKNEEKTAALAEQQTLFKEQIENARLTHQAEVERIQQAHQQALKASADKLDQTYKTIREKDAQIQTLSSSEDDKSVKLRKQIESLEKALAEEKAAHEKTIKKYEEQLSVLGVAIGHFFGPIRAVIALVAGIVKMPFWPFQVANFAASFAWGFGLIYGAGRFSEYMMQFTGK